MTNSTTAFCRQLAEQFPDIGKILSEHVADYDEILPSVFMGDVTRYVLNDGVFRTQVVDALETAFINQVAEVEELIAVSFVENITSQDEFNTAFRDAVAPMLQAEWLRQRSS